MEISKLGIKIRRRGIRMNRWIKFLFCALPCFAQVDTGAITGVVSDRSG